MRSEADQVVQTCSTFKELAHAGQILSSLNSINDYAKVHACRAQAKLPDVIDSTNYSEDLFYYSEVYRLFECSTMAQVVGDRVSDLLSNPSDKLAKIDDYYFAFMLYKRAQHYGAKRSENLMDALSEEATRNWLKNFNARLWTLERVDEEGDTVQDYLTI